MSTMQNQASWREKTLARAKSATVFAKEHPGFAALVGLTLLSMYFCGFFSIITGLLFICTCAAFLYAKADSAKNAIAEVITENFRNLLGSSRKTDQSEQRQHEQTEKMPARENSDGWTSWLRSLFPSSGRANPDRQSLMRISKGMEKDSESPSHKVKTEARKQAEIDEYLTIAPLREEPSLSSMFSNITESPFVKTNSMTKA